MPKFHDLVVFQRALDLSVQIYEITSSFPKQELYGLTAQLRRAAYGVVSNIAEGEGRLTFGERRQFLSQARGSLFEVEAQALIAERLKFLSAADHARIDVAIQKTGRALIGYIRWVKKQEDSAKPRHRATSQPITATPRSTQPHPPAPAPKKRPPAT
jgi:four helix bundle protein